MDNSDISQFIAENNINAEIVYLPEKTLTVEAAAVAVGVHTDQIGKSLLFIVDGEPVLVIANGTARVNYKHLAHHFGINRKQLRMANAAQVLNITGFTVGTVPPFGHKIRLKTFMDHAVLAQTELYAGGGAENALVRIAPSELHRVTGATIIQFSR